MTTYRQQRSFAAETDGSLESAIAWIETNLAVYDVFAESEIHKAVVAGNRPEDIFPHKELVEWAEEEGYTLKNEEEK
jgi:hypothetical protein